MTRQEFINNVTEWSELIEFCNDMDCSYCDDVVSEDDLGERIRDDYIEFGHQYSWTEIRGWLDNIVDGYDYYVRQGSFEYVYLDDEGDFDEYKNDVIGWMDDNGLWDEDYDDTEEDEEDLIEETLTDGEDDEEIPEEDITVSDLFSMCSGMLQTIEEDKQKAAKEEEEQLARFICYRK